MATVLRKIEKECSEKIDLIQSKINQEESKKLYKNLRRVLKPDLNHTLYSILDTTNQTKTMKLRRKNHSKSILN